MVKRLTAKSGGIVVVARFADRYTLFAFSNVPKPSQTLPNSCSWRQFHNFGIPKCFQALPNLPKVSQTPQIPPKPFQTIPNLRKRSQPSPQPSKPPKPAQTFPSPANPLKPSQNLPKPFQTVPPPPLGAEKVKKFKAFSSCDSMPCFGKAKIVWKIGWPDNWQLFTIFLGIQYAPSHHYW